MKRTIQRVKFSTQRSLLLLAALISSAYLSMVYAEGGTASDTIVICVLCLTCYKYTTFF